MKQRVLTIEDDPAIRRGIVDALRFAGYEPLQAGDLPEGLKLALHREYDLLLLDLVLPRGSGFDILTEVRERRPTLPVIILTARGEEADRVRGLHDGADDYVVKPFSVKELLARVEAVLRRSPARASDLELLDMPHGEVDLQRREVKLHNGQQVEISQLEADLLRYLACNSKRAIAREELLENVWRLSPQGLSTRTIDMHVARLREKLGDDARHPRVVVTVRGKGYKWAVGDE